MIYMFLIVSVLCGWAVFSKTVKDDIVEKHCLAFASILSALAVFAYITDHIFLEKSIAGSAMFLIGGALYSCIKYYARMVKDASKA